jgi:virginiamycin A acetyltransferase
MPFSFPSPDTKHPLTLPDGSAHTGTVFLRSVVDHPRIEIGDYSYASAFEPPSDWAARLAPYLYDFSPERLKIGRFCQIADGVTFITSSANHRYDGFSSYPFAIFDGGPSAGRPSLPGPETGRDTELGHDVWLGRGATVLPGTKIGNGVIVGAGAVVGGTVPSYSVVAGNPAGVIRRRFAQDVIEALERMAWWDWEIERILEAEAALCGGDIDALRPFGA